MVAREKIPVRTLLLLGGVILLVIVLFMAVGERMDAWTAAWIEQARPHRLAAGVFMALLLTVNVVIPVPSSLVSTACGMVLGFAGGMLASVAGMTGTVAAGYALGRFASRPAQRLIGSREAVMLQTLYRRYGPWMLLALRPVPILAEASVLFSGIARHPWRRVLGMTLLGNVAVSAVYVSVGVLGREADAFLAAFGLSILVSGLFMLVLRQKSHERDENGFDRTCRDDWRKDGTGHDGSGPRA